MFSKSKTSSQECSPDYHAKLSRFKDADTDALIDLYKDVERSYKDISHALEHASAAQTLYYSADARSCKDALTEIQCVLFTRGVREFASMEGS